MLVLVVEVIAGLRHFVYTKSCTDVIKVVAIVMQNIPRVAFQHKDSSLEHAEKTIVSLEEYCIWLSVNQYS